jgi:hypothetical protein
MASGSFATMSATIGVSMVPGHTALIADTPGGIFERGTLRQPDHPVLGCQAGNRRGVDDGAAALLAHLAQLVFHAVPDAAQIDRVHALEFFAADISHFHGRGYHAGVIERGIEATKGGYRLLDHCGYLSLVRDIAADGNRLMAGGTSCSAAERTAFSWTSASATAAPASAKALAVVRPMPEPAPVTRATLFSKDEFIM